VVKGMQTIEAMLKKSRGVYCFGDQITAADLFFVPQVQGSSVRFNVSLDDYPNIKEVLANLQKIEAFEKAQPQNQPDFEK
jgi:glutathione S-transferase